jgi:outer membrane protein
MRKPHVHIAESPLPGGPSERWGAGAVIPRRASRLAPRRASQFSTGLSLAFILAAAGCIHNPPNVDGKPSAPTSPNSFWQPPKRAVTRDSVPQVAIPPDIADRVARLTLPDVVDIALSNNPQTRQSYSQARAAGATIGAAQGKYLPQVSLDGTAAREGSSSSGSAPLTGGTGSTGTGSGSTGTGSGSGSSGTVIKGGGYHSLFEPSATVSWLLFDFSESPSIEMARQTTFAASYTHNATVQTVVLGVEQAYFSYNSAKAVRDADAETVREDSANLAAANARHVAGVATISDILQARTTLSQAELTIETDEGTVQTTRGALAVAMGFPANVPYDIAPEPPNIPVQSITESVDSLVQVAVRSRPDLASFRAQTLEAQANIGVIKGQGLPSFFASGSASRTIFDDPALDGNTYSAQVGVSIPLFQGFQNAYNVLQARELAKANAANTEFQRDQVVYQVFTSFYNLRTATSRVKSSDDLLASAQESYNVESDKYKQGIGSILDLLTAQAALASARSQQASARWTWYSNLAQLSHDVGVIGLHGETHLNLAGDSTISHPSR